MSDIIYGYGYGDAIPEFPATPGVGTESFPLMSLEEFREEIGYNPWHFWGLAGAKAPLTSNCNTVVNEYAWQTAQSAGRYDIRRAILRAEEKVKPWLGYAVAPAYQQVTLDWPRYPQEDVYRLGYSGSDLRWVTLNVGEGEIRSLGVQSVTLKSADVAITYSDSDGDGLNDTWTTGAISLSGVTDPEQVSVYQPAAYRLEGKGLVESTRVRPVTITYDTLSAKFTISGRAWLMVRPALYQAGGTLDPAVAANFMDKVDIATNYCDSNGTTGATAHALLIWETPPYPLWATWMIGWNSVDPSATATALARGTLRNGKHGIVGLGEAVYDPSTDTWSQVPWFANLYKIKPPDRVILRFRAGADAAPGGRISEAMRALVVPLAAAELHRRICGCEEANRVLYDYQFDVARSGGAAGEAYAMMTREMLNNPFGTKRGEIDTWLKVKGRRILTGMSV